MGLGATGDPKLASARPGKLKNAQKYKETTLGDAKNGILGKKRFQSHKNWLQQGLGSQNIQKNVQNVKKLCGETLKIDFQAQK